MKARGFTILEILIVISVIAILVGISMPRIQRMQSVANISKAKRELKTLQVAIESYKMYHSNTNPANITTDLTGASPQMITSALTDPFGAGDYKYKTTGQYYVVSSVGPNGTDETAAPLATGDVSVAGDDLAASNGKITVAGSIVDAAICVQNADCASGACGGKAPVCLPTGSTDIGEGCVQGSECKSGYCHGIDQVCTDGLGGCGVDDSECQGGYCNTWHNLCSDGSIGSVCWNDSHCQPQLHCDGDSETCVAD